MDFTKIFLDILFSPIKGLERAILNRPSSDDPNAGMGGGQLGRIMGIKFQEQDKKKEDL